MPFLFIYYLYGVQTCDDQMEGLSTFLKLFESALLTRFALPLFSVAHVLVLKVEEAITAPKNAKGRMVELS